MAFATIFAAPGLSAAQQRLAAGSGPPCVLTRRDHHDMLAAAGFGSVEEIDLTPAYLAAVRGWLTESRRREGALRAALGDEVFDARQSDRRLQISGLQAGVLRRSIFVARLG
jgi:hypothetical protein